MYFLILFLLLWAPGIVVNIGLLNAYSDAFNILNVLVIIILVTWRRVFLFPSKSILTKLVLINLFLTFSLIFPLIYNFKFDFIRFITSLTALNLMFICVIQFLPFFNTDNIKTTVKSSIIFSFFSLGFMILFILGVKEKYGMNHYFAFTEISHFALCSAPLFLFSFYYLTNKKLKIILIVLIVLVGILTPNLSILILIPLFYFKRLNIRSLFLLLLLPLLFYFISSSYFLARINSVVRSGDELQNTSGLVFIQGWEFCLNLLHNGYFVGMGFQQMGTTNILFSETSYLIQQIAGEFLSVKDGSFFFSKLFVEFGLITFYFILLFLLWYRKLLLSKPIFSPGNIFLVASANAFLFMLFIRGMGYFNFGVFWAILAYIYLNKNNIQNVIKSY